MLILSANKLEAAAEPAQVTTGVRLLRAAIKKLMLPPIKLAAPENSAFALPDTTTNRYYQLSSLHKASIVADIQSMMAQ